MYDYSERIEAFRDKKVRLSPEFREKLLAHRKANRDRLIARLPDFIKGVSISESSFKPQGSFAMGTVIQTRFVDEEYDIDDGLVLGRDELVDENGVELTAQQVKEKVRDALKDDRFNRQPKICGNCVRVFYADEDEEKHHVDFPIYRRYFDANGNKVRELAGENGWVVSDPTQVNNWMDNQVEIRNKASAGWGTQFRHLIQLLKRFCRSRSDWDLPNGMKLTMLIAECQPAFNVRIDIAFRELLKKLHYRLIWNKIIQNLADAARPPITRTASDQNVVDLLSRIGEALDELARLDTQEANNVDSARSVWDWVFKSDGFLAEFDRERKQKEKEKALLARAALIGSGARTSAYGVIGSAGVPNPSHSFYGGKKMDQS
jgi:cyclic GMP-AMP synthase DncV-like protein